MTINCGDNRPVGRLVLGVTVMVLGLALALDNFGLFQVRYIFRLWPVVLIAIGLTRLQQSVRHGGRPEGYVLTLVGVGLLLMNFGLLGFRQARNTITPPTVRKRNASAWRGTSGSSPDAFSLESSQRMDAFALLGGVHRVSRATEFRGGSASAALGGCDIDLREADMPEGGSAVLDTLAIMGGIEVRVPEDWSVETRGTPRTRPGR